jgi:hypothetical protein
MNITTDFSLITFSVMCVRKTDISVDAVNQEEAPPRRKRKWRNAHPKT